MRALRGLGKLPRGVRAHASCCGPAHGRPPAHARSASSATQDVPSFAQQPGLTDREATELFQNNTQWRHNELERDLHFRPFFSLFAHW